MPMMPRLLLSLLCGLMAATPALAEDTRDPVDAFLARTGARLVFERDALPPGDYYDRMPPLSRRARQDAARLLLAEAAKYPVGYLGAIGLRSVGVFESCVSKTGDGFRPFDARLGGYRYYGLWNGNDAVVACYYSDSQLPLTFHHEVFHHVDATVAGITDRSAHFSADDARFRAALSGTRRHRRADLSTAEERALKRASAGLVLRGAVSGYATKHPGEDQAETARHVMTALPDSLVQAANQPELPGSQRILHVLERYRLAAVDGPGIAWFIDVALNRQPDLRAAARDAEQRMRRRILRSDQDDSDFVVWAPAGYQGGGNTVLQSDVEGFGRDARRLARQAAASPEAIPEVRRVIAQNLDRLDRYQRYIDRRWGLSRSTTASFARARRAMADALSTRQPLPALLNPYLEKVDAAIAEPDVRAAIRRVQPATVRIGGGSGVNLRSDGLVLTNAHVAKAVGRRFTVTFPDGTRAEGRTTAIDNHWDLALVDVRSDAQLPTAPLAPDPPSVGDKVVAIGQPGSRTPEGSATGYQPFHVSRGRIRGLLANPLGTQALGRTMHDAWTYWGHSGSPLFSESGGIVALHNSWDPRTAMRHAVPHQAIRAFIERHGVTR